MIRDVLAGIGHGSVRLHDDLVGTVVGIALFRRILDNPASCIFPLGFLNKIFRFLQELECFPPKVHRHDVTFPNQQVVVDGKLSHGP